MANEQTEETLLVVRPLMWRGEPAGFICCVALILACGLGLVLLLIWWLWCQSTIYKITNLRVVEQTGILSRNTNEVRHVDVRNVKMNQGIFQRIYGTGSVAVSSAGQSDIELTMKNIENPKKIVDTIRMYQS